MPNPTPHEGLTPERLAHKWMALEPPFNETEKKARVVAKAFIATKAAHAALLQSHDALAARVRELEAQALPVIDPDADDTMGQTIPITESRLFDLVRFKRGELLDDGLITLGEWTWLTTGATPDVPGAGSPSRKRLERYDELAARNDALAAEHRALQARLAQVAPHICPECGPFARVDEDGCCAACGADTYFESAPHKTATRPPEAPEDVEVRRLLAEADRVLNGPRIPVTPAPRLPEAPEGGAVYRDMSEWLNPDTGPKGDPR